MESQEQVSRPLDGEEGATNAQRRQAFGTLLRETREQAGVSVISLAQSTRISLTFLHALESGDLDLLPGRVFGRGFVRNIARTLDVDPEPLVEAYEACWEKGPTKTKKIATPTFAAAGKAGLRSMAQGLSSLARSRTFLISAAVVVLSLGGFAIYGLLPKSLPTASVAERSQKVPAPKEKPAEVEVEATAEPVTSPAPTEETHAAAPISEAPPSDHEAVAEATPAPAESAEGERVVTAGEARFEQVLKVTVTSPVRVRVGLDGKPAEIKELEPDVYTFSFEEEANFLIFDAAALDIEFNGRPLGSLGQKGRVRRLSFRAKRPLEAL